MSTSQLPSKRKANTQAARIAPARIIRPTAHDARTLLDLLDNPPPPNAKLRAALQRHKALFDTARHNTATPASSPRHVG